MKTTPVCLLTLTLLALLPACSKKTVEVTGQVFVVTKGRENIKMGGLEVRVIPDGEFLNLAKATVPWMQEEARKEAQRRIDADFMTSFILEVRAMEEVAPKPIPELSKIRNDIVEESQVSQGLLESALSAELLPRSVEKLISDATSTFSVTTDADGRFMVPVTGKNWFLAAGERTVGEETEKYLWVKAFEPQGEAPSATLAISNEADIDSVDGLYSLLAAAISTPEGLEAFRKVEVSKEMTSLVAKHREATAEAKAKAAEAKAEEEAAYAKLSGKRAGEEKIIEIASKVEMTLCWCPAGEFTMGSPNYEADRNGDENQVKVTLSQGFWMAKTEVTQAQWQAVMGGNPPSEFRGANRPVENVSWNDAQEFLTKVNAIVGNLDGGKMVLPTEAQWEYAARAGETGPYSGGRPDEVAWYWDNGGGGTHPVGTKKPNAWGLHDMHGNVGEWCADWYTSELKGGADPRGAASGASRVGRGGGWGLNALLCRVAGRFNVDPSVTYDYIGFRVARISVPQ